MVKVDVSNKYWVEDMFIVNGKLCLITIDFEAGYRTLHINIDSDCIDDIVIDKLPIDATVSRMNESPVIKGCSLATGPWLLFEFSANNSANEFVDIRNIINSEKLTSSLGKGFVSRLNRLIESQRRYDLIYPQVKLVHHPTQLIKELAGKIIELINEFTIF